MYIREKQLGTGQATKTDDFLEKFQRGEGQGVILNPKIHIADFGPLYSALNRDFRKKNCNIFFRK